MPIWPNCGREGVETVLCARGSTAVVAPPVFYDQRRTAAHTKLRQWSMRIRSLWRWLVVFGFARCSSSSKNPLHFRLRLGLRRLRTMSDVQNLKPGSRPRDLPPGVDQLAVRSESGNAHQRVDKSRAVLSAEQTKWNAPARHRTHARYSAAIYLQREGPAMAVLRGDDRWYTQLAAESAADEDAAIFDAVDWARVTSTPR